MGLQCAAKCDASNGSAWIMMSPDRLAKVLRATSFPNHTEITPMRSRAGQCAASTTASSILLRSRCRKLLSTKPG